MLIRTEVGVIEEVYMEVKDLKGIQTAAMITGPYDIMAIVETEGLGEITRDIIESIRGIEGVKETSTNIFIE